MPGGGDAGPHGGVAVDDEATYVLARRRMGAKPRGEGLGRVAFAEMMLLFTAYLVVTMWFVPLGRWLTSAGSSVDAAALGLVVVLACLFGHRSGSRGGIMPIDRIALTYVLAAPLSWTRLLRPLLVRPFVVTLGATTWLGCMVGTGAALHLPVPAWKLALAGTCFLGVLGGCYIGAALLAYASPQVGRVFGTALLATLLAGLVDLMLHTSLAWTTALGQTLLLRASPLLIAWGAVPALLVPMSGLLAIRHIAADRVVGHNEAMWSWALSIGDESPRAMFRSYQRMSGEAPRRRPLLPFSGRLMFRHPVFARDLAGLLRSSNAALGRGGVLLGIGVVAFAQLGRGRAGFGCCSDSAGICSPCNSWRASPRKARFPSWRWAFPSRNVPCWRVMAPSPWLP
ncbi:MAG: hypothetical protein ABR573_01310 [Candidatus Dormibacteria bacterium]